MTQAPATPSFGDVVENGWASEENPTRKGYFVRSFKRIGRINPGLTWLITDRAGYFWELQPRVIGDKLTVTPLADALEAQQARIAELEGLLKSLRLDWSALTNTGSAIAKINVRLIDQALSSQGRREGVGEDVLPELPGVNAVPASPDGPRSSQSPRVSHGLHMKVVGGKLIYQRKSRIVE